MVTYGLFFHLAFFYAAFYLYPTIWGDFKEVIGIDSPWKSQTERDNAKASGITYGIIFCCIALLEFVSITRVILTSPGTIPEEREWDMVSESGTGTSDAEEERRRRYDKMANE